MYIKAQLKGADELQRMLLALPRKLVRKALSQALRDSAKKMLVAIKAAAPVDTGALRDGNWRVRVAKSRKRKRGSMAIGYVVLSPTRKSLGIPEDAKGYYPAAVEYGSVKMDAQPFIRPTAIKQAASTVADSRDAIKQNIARLAREAAKKGI